MVHGALLAFAQNSSPPQLGLVLLNCTGSSNGPVYVPRERRSMDYTGLRGRGAGPDQTRGMCAMVGSSPCADRGMLRYGQSPFACSIYRMAV